MPHVTSPESGSFCWPELYTPDQSGAKVFYVRLFGWELRDIPIGPGAVYTIFTLGGRDAAACYGALPEMVEQGIRPHWIAYVSVASSDETATKAKAAGGKVVKDPFDVPGIGRMSVLQDPTGATICSWQPSGHSGIGVYQEPGALQWTELLTNDTEAAAAFYQSVFGWRRQLWPSPEEVRYHMFMRGGTAAGGMIPITPEMGPVKPAWVSYFQVRDCDATVAKALQLGGSISVPAETVPSVGRFAVVIDPAGAHFGIMQPAS
jgi:predicted enzyme related to lactoylglutathione lyase